jgi:RNA polymerase sigma-70 factor (ECF subfamily)
MPESNPVTNVVVSGPWTARARKLDVPVGLSDAELVALLLRDPSANAGKLHDRYAPIVNRLVWRLLGADADHDDLVQQVFCKIIEHAGRLRDPSRLGVWVQRTTVNTVYEELRRREVRRLFLRERTQAELHPDLTRDTEIRDLLLCALTLLGRLPAKERIVFVLHFVEGYRLREVADLCGISLRTAKRRLGAVNGRFRKLAAEHPEYSKLFGYDKEET